MASVTNIKIPYAQEGIVRAAEISDVMRVSGSCQLAINFNFDSIGAIQTRAGMTQYIPAAGGEIISFGAYSQNASSVRRLLYQVGSTVYSYNPVTNVSTSVRSLSSSNKGRYAQFTDLMYMINGVSGGDNIQSFNGTTFSSSNIGALTKGDFIEVYEGRLWVGDQAADKLYYTDIIDISQTITGGTEFLFKLAYSNGQKMTALKTVPRSLLMFRTDSIYRIYSGGDNASADSYPVSSKVGTYSQESVVQTKQGLLFHHPTGIYKYNFDSEPIEVSRRISDVIAAIDRSMYEKIHGWEDGNHAYWFVGDLDLPEGTFPNCTIRYTINTELWTIYSSKDKLTASVVFDDANDILEIVGVGTTGITAKYGEGKTDLGKDIICEYITGNYSVTDTFASAKQFDKMAVAHTNAAGFGLDYKIDKMRPNEWHSMGSLDERFVTILPSQDGLTFNQISLRLKGVINGDPAYIYGIETLNADDEGYKSES